MTETKIVNKEYIQIEFDRQWKGVVKDYPLIASIFMTPDKKSKKVVKAFLSAVNLQDYVARLSGPFRNLGTAAKIATHLSNCINNLKKGLGMAQDYSEGKATMDQFSQCWTGKID